jgi:hypothetical protein
VFEDELDDRPKDYSRTKTRVRFAAGFIACVTLLRLVPFVTWHTEDQPDGNQVSVMNVWAQSFSYVHGDSPNWQRHTLSDGTQLEGRLTNGQKDDRWVIKRNGHVIKSIEFYLGDVVSEVDPQRVQQ